MNLSDIEIAIDVGRRRRSTVNEIGITEETLFDGSTIAPSPAALPWRQII